MSNENCRVRRLTPKECWRLMGFSDDDYEKARNAMNKEIYHDKDRSSSQLFKQAGNSIVVNVLVYIMRNIKDAMPYLFEDIQIGSFFSGIGAFEKSLSVMDDERYNIEYSENDNPELHQLGVVGTNHMANRIYDNTVSCTIKAEGGGGGQRLDGIKLKCVNSMINGKQPSLHNRIYDAKGISTAITTAPFLCLIFMFTKNSAMK